MNENFNQKKIVKRLYFTVAVALVAVSASGIVANYQGKKLGENSDTTKSSIIFNETTDDILKETQIFNNTENDDEEETTKNVSKDKKEKNNEPLITKSTEIGTEPEIESKKVTDAETVKASITFSKPLSGNITKEFSLSTPQYNQTLDDWRVHTGTDISAKEGEEVLSVGDGVVKKVYVDRSWGYVIEVDHGDFLGRYCGISQDGAVSINEKVKKGSVIGVLTSIPCESADGIHLHFEIEKDGNLVNPTEILK